MINDRPTALPIDPWGTPDTGFKTFRVTSPYGNRSDQVGDRPVEFHGGLDLGNARLGDLVTAVGPGTVILASAEPAPPWNWPTPAAMVLLWGPSYGGRVIVVRHDSGVWSQYAHLGAMAVRKGDTVRSGQTLGQVGESGSAQGRGHLHFGIRLRSKIDNGHDGWVDPWPLIADAAAEDDMSELTECRAIAERRLARIKALEDRVTSLRNRLNAMEDLDAVELLARLEQIREIANAPIPEEA
jgi:murein DD-endopeptidase MepM/ murein hydrolase activator NlpD